MDWTLAGIVRTHAGARANKPMITYGARVISYAEMHVRFPLLALP